MNKLTPETVQTADDMTLARLIEAPDTDRELFALADKVRREIYGDEVYVRGLIEFTNHCKNDCLYCGIRRSNRDIGRYRLTEEQIINITRSDGSAYIYSHNSRTLSSCCFFILRRTSSG